jgi:N-acetylneuraminate synthase/N,N'-diacetyllegionaminate synthase
MSWSGSVFVIAEAGVNHNGDLGLGLRLVDAAAEAGCDAVKFQTFKAETLVSRSAPKARYQQLTTREDESQLEMLRRLELDRAAHEALRDRCRSRGIQFLSTPFDPESADLLSELDVPLFKVPSGEITNFPLLAHIGRKGKPVILSTGMSFLGEVEAALEVLRGAGAKEITLLHCTSSYPAAPADANLLAMLTLRQAFGVPVGYSDHTLGLEVAIAAVALGATVIEKHFTLDRSLPGPDHRASLEPRELSALVSAIRNVERALGDGVKRPVPAEMEMREAARRSIVAAVALPANTVLTAGHLALKRPGTGLPPSRLASLVGRVLKRDVAADELLTEDALG